jgi:hypothetical protein
MKSNLDGFDDRDVENEKRKQTFDELALNVVQHLESFDEITSIDFKSSPVSSFDMFSWERNNPQYRLPEDMKAFYTVLNGFDLRWKVEIGKRHVEVGQMKVVELKELTTTSPAHPSQMAAFIICSQQDIGDILLIFTCGVSSPPGTSSSTSSSAGGTTGGRDSEIRHDSEIWFRDTELRYHYMCPSFTHLLRVMVAHLGISGWQYVYTPQGLSSATQQFMSIFCKERLCIDRIATEGPVVA